MATDQYPNQVLIDRLIETGKVAAIGLGGSSASGMAATGSDLDLYIITRNPIDPEVRRAIIEPLADDPFRIDIANPYWGDEDGVSIDGAWHDLAYFDAQWLATEVDEVLTDHRARQGYTTSFIFTMANMVPLHDPEGLLASWKRRTGWYPDDLAEAIIAYNYPVCAVIHASYRNQIIRAVQLNDPVAVNHRVAAFLASVFDIAFAHIRAWHPGEKRQLQYLQDRQHDLPPAFEEHIRAVLNAAAPVRGEELVLAVDKLVEDITIIAEQGIQERPD